MKTLWHQKVQGGVDDKEAEDRQGMQPCSWQVDLAVGGSGSGIFGQDTLESWDNLPGTLLRLFWQRDLQMKVPSMNIKLIEKKNNSNISRESGICQLCDSLRESEEKG